VGFALATGTLARLHAARLIAAPAASVAYALATGTHF